MTYEAAVAYLAGLAPRGWRLGLDRMRDFVRRTGLGDTLGGMEGPRYLHVAGTNGKGSVTAYLQSVLHEAGHRVGGYYSPYVYDIRERIQLGRRLIEESEFAALVESLAPVAEEFDGSEYGPISEFEFKTAMGLRFWKEQGCDWVALEVGLGGRLDATNIVTPAAGAIVSIGYDHTGILGDTLAQIAAEKAGIAKPGVPLVVGDVAEEAFASIEEVAGRVGAPVLRLVRDFAYRTEADGTTCVQTSRGAVEGLLPGIPGVVQPHNAAVAVAVLHAAGLCPDSDTVRRGIAAARMPGRFERREANGTPVILDGAHNGESVRALVETFRKTFPETPRPLVLIAGMVQGHDPAVVLGPLVALADRVHLTPIAFRRTYDTATLRRALPTAAHEHPEARAALAAALADAGNTGLVLVAGSFYLVGEVGRLLDES